MSNYIYSDQLSTFHKELNKRSTNLNSLLNILKSKDDEIQIKLNDFDGTQEVRGFKNVKHNLKLVNFILQDALKCNGEIKLMKQPDHEILIKDVNYSRLLFMNNVDKVKILISNSQLKEKLIEMKTKLHDLIQEEKHIRKNDLNIISKNAKLNFLEKEHNSIIKKKSLVMNNFEKIKDLGYQLKLHKALYDESELVLLKVRKDITDQTINISNKKKLCLKKIIEMNFQISAARNLSVDLKELYMQMLIKKEEISQFLIKAAKKQPGQLEIWKNPNNKKLYPVILAYLEMYFKNRQIIDVNNSIISVQDDLKEESASIELYNGKLKNYFYVLNMKLKEVFDELSINETKFWEVVSKIDTVLSEWPILKLKFKNQDP